MLIIGLGCGLGTAGDLETVKGFVLLGMAGRILAIALVSVVIGLVIGSISKVAIAVSIGVLLADLALFTFYLVTSHNRVSHFYLRDFFAFWSVNPLAVMALFTYPGVAVKTRRLALKLGVYLSVVVPTLFVVGLFVWFYHSNRRSIWDWTVACHFVLFWLITVVVTVPFGAFGTTVARLVVEIWEDMTATNARESVETEQIAGIGKEVTERNGASHRFRNDGENGG
jgi:hypothetical protein